jgi:hypothetical protein
MIWELPIKEASGRLQRPADPLLATRVDGFDVVDYPVSVQLIR